MRTEILIHKFNETYMVVNVVGEGAERQFFPCLESKSWRMVSEQYLRFGASKIALDEAHQEVDTNGTARLLI